MAQSLNRSLLKLRPAVWMLALALLTTTGLKQDIAVPLNTLANSDVGDDFKPQMVTDGEGLWISIWYTRDSLGDTIGTDEDIVITRSMDQGVTWSTTDALVDFPGADRNPFLATDGNGVWIAAWTSTNSLGGTIGNDFDLLFSRSTDGGETWSDPASLNSAAVADSSVDTEVHLATDGSGTWIASWRAELPASAAFDFEIRMARSTDHGVTWQPSTVLANELDPGKDPTPETAADGAGNWIAVWHSGDSLGDTIGTDRDIFYSKSTDNGVNWTLPDVLNSNATNEPGKSDTVPRIRHVEGDDWFVMWESRDDLGTLGRDRDVLMQHTSDGGSSWTLAAPVSPDAAIDDEDDDLDNEPEVAFDGVDTWVVSWTRGPDNGDRRIVSLRSFDGGQTWTAPVGMNFTNEQDGPRFASDGEGNWLSAWHARDSFVGASGTDRDTWFARLSLIQNGGFEVAEDVSAGMDTEQPEFPGDWKGDSASLVMAELGIAPIEGEQMLRFDATSGVGPNASTKSNQWQIMDLAAVAADRAAGHTNLKATAFFNRMAGDADTDTRFGLSLHAYAGEMNSFPDQWLNSELASVVEEMDTDDDPATWEAHSVELALPEAADFAVVRIYAEENVSNNTGDAEFDGHYADALRAVLRLSDLDLDGILDDADNCPTIANEDQADGDGDGVGDVCDNCVSFHNPRGEGGGAAPTFTGNQLDSDGDGYGNACDGDFDQLLPIVAGPDLTQMRLALGKHRDSNTCPRAPNDGVNFDAPCARFDLVSDVIPIIALQDLNRFRMLLGKPPGPKCADCPLPNLP